HLDHLLRAPVDRLPTFRRGGDGPLDDPGFSPRELDEGGGAGPDSGRAALHDVPDEHGRSLELPARQALHDRRTMDRARRGAAAPAGLAACRGTWAGRPGTDGRGGRPERRALADAVRAYFLSARAPELWSGPDRDHAGDLLAAAVPPGAAARAAGVGRAGRA